MSQNLPMLRIQSQLRVDGCGEGWEEMGKNTSKGQIFPKKAQKFDQCHQIENEVCSGAISVVLQRIIYQGPVKTS